MAASFEINGYKFKTKPWEHQLKALSFLMGRNLAALYTDMGTGKTKVMIDLIQNKGFKTVLVVAPKKACDVWCNQIRTHAYSRRVAFIRLYKRSTESKVELIQKLIKTRAEHFKNKTVILLVNYDSVWMQPFGDKLKYKRLGLDCIICDESHRIKSPSSKVSIFLYHLGKRVQYRYLVTGTPIAERPEDAYAQYRFLDPSVFGTQFTAFCETYQNVDLAASARLGYTVLKRENPYKNLELLRQKMFTCAFYAKSSLKLPKTRSIAYPVELSGKMQKTYKEMTKNGALVFDELFATTENILTLIMRQQQLTSGFLPLEDVDGNKTLKEMDKSKLEALEELLDGLYKTEPVVIFARFTKDLENIKILCKKMKRRYAELSGKTDKSDAWKAGKYDVLGVQYQSGAESVDFTRAKYCIFYSFIHSYRLYAQARKRVHRPGQKHPVTYYFLVAKIQGVESIDDKIIKAWKSKKNVAQYLMQNDHSSA